MIRELKDDGKSYIKIFLIGILVGCITRLLDYYSLDTLWSWSSIQTLLGFWMISNTIIVVKSSSNKCAGISSFLYMFGMTLSFYGLQVILGMFIPMFSDRFRFSLFIMFTILSIPCAIAAFILYYWNKNEFYNSVLYSLPVGALFSETVAIAIKFHMTHTFLFQLLMDGIGTIAFGVLFFKKVKNRYVYLFSIIISFLVFYFILYHREVLTWLE
ncbi:TPA: hypothetical protein U1366_000925 [Streptococcus suis]|uniref:hypothetical protein n=1 Tax=Streptococcus suis TaxID=1307 RepID=UPI00076994AD|nr:hypothetical protein [Streptococcus suis]NQH15836.1 hypothetical protein [Streptococcus suis]CYU81760.1 Uncharacterised protein [Streptococcus suis]HEL2495793.1 hypothetical protein [Streptococcus suis]HEL2734154.1 hypothetical protein [Streptococcus suis]HEL9635456.1 hypothetical protein [Streptococcus suis]